MMVAEYNAHETQAAPGRAIRPSDPRSGNLDAFRGMSVLLMVLSGSIAFGDVLPAWMFHAQVPPADHVFKPGLAGITWVDLVFPFFLFSMGAAIPLSLKGKSDDLPVGKVLLSIIQRCLLLVFFALFTVHARATAMSSSPSTGFYLLSIGCFCLLFPIFLSKDRLPLQRFRWLKGVALAAAVIFMTVYPFPGGGFDPEKNDVIIIILANMALLGSFLWLSTRYKPWMRVAILPPLMAILLAGNVDQSWNSTVYNWSPFPWMYQFVYLKYLFIVIPGTFAGEWLQEARSAGDTGRFRGSKIQLTVIVALCWILTATNVIALFERHLLLNLGATAGLSFLMLYLLKQTRRIRSRVKFGYAGIYLLLLGLAFEAFEGGVKKDPSTFSYYFITAGLAFIILLSFIILEYLGYFSRSVRFLANTGKNPMIAYTAGNLLLIPLLNMTGAIMWLDAFNTSAWGGFLRGIIFTGIVAMITVYCTRKKVFWRT